MTFGVHDVDPDSMFEQQCRDAFNLGKLVVSIQNTRRQLAHALFYYRKVFVPFQ